MRDEDKEFWRGRPEDRSAFAKRMRAGGLRPWLVAAGIAVAIWLLISLVATLMDTGDGLVFALP
jgi:hypothetical protein